MAIAPDPIRGNIFKVEIDDVEVEGWRYANIPAISTAPEDDGWGESVLQPLEMERGVLPGDTYIHDWQETISDGDEDAGLRTVVVTLIDQDGSDLLRWTFEDAWITYYRPPQLDGASDDIATERITVAFDSMEREDL